MSNAPALAGKVAIVTGATAGIGLWTALGLARQGARLVITGRSAARLAEAVAWIRQRAPEAEIDAEQADFASLKQVRAMGERLRAQHPRIAVLVNNAGVMALGRVTTEDGYESTFQINHLAPFLLTLTLLPSLEAAAPARIVNVASQASKFAKIDFADFNLSRAFGMMSAYGQSKLANVMTTYALARRVDGTGVTVNAIHPGLVASNFGNKGPVTKFIWSVLMRPFMLTAEQGAQNAIYAATAPELEGRSALYLVDKKPAPSNPISYDEAAVERLWRESVRMTGAETLDRAA